MDALKLKTMAQSATPSIWEQIFTWIKDNTIMFACFALSWKAIDKVYRYLKETKEEELRKIVHDEMNPSIKELSEKIGELEKAIWALNLKK